MWINKKLMLGLALILFLGSCASKKTVSGPAGATKELSKRETKILLEGIEQHQFIYETFNTKARAKLAVDNKNFNATLNIRIKHQEVIWISAHAFLGIEAARIMITPDRIQIINRLQSTYIDKPFDYIYNFTSAGISFEELENLLVGNSLSLYKDPANKLLLTANQYQVSGNLENLDYEINLSPEFQILNTLLSEAAKGQSLRFAYQEYQSIEEHSVPQGVDVDVRAAKLKLNASMKYEDITINETLSFPFSVPERYKKI